MSKARVQPYLIEPWRSEHDSTGFSSGMSSIDRYIKEQARRDMSSHALLVFVLTEPGKNIARLDRSNGTEIPKS